MMKNKVKSSYNMNEEKSFSNSNINWVMGKVGCVNYHYNKK